MLLDLGILFIPFVFIAMLGTVNGVNLTDGLDGLSSGVTLLVASFFAIVAWAAGSTVSPVCGAIIGGLLAFLMLTLRKYSWGIQVRLRWAALWHRPRSC